ncbi:glycosyltransferase family 2 protein [bacterium]|nr:glycosyltransferase family 2 protein [bacterium]
MVNLGVNESKISIVIPLFNEEKRISLSLEYLKELYSQNPFELIFVDDGSSDGTLDILDRNKGFPYRVISYSPNRGKGFAVRTGILQSSGDIVLFMDGDLAISPEYIPEFAAKLKQGYDLVIASKIRSDSKNFIRKFASRLFNLLTRSVLDLTYKDTQGGFKMFSNSAARTLFLPLKETGFAFDVELLHRARLEGLKVFEFPVEWREDVRNSRVRVFKDSLIMFFKILKIRKYR